MSPGICTKGMVLAPVRMSIAPTTKHPSPHLKRDHARANGDFIGDLVVRMFASLVLGNVFDTCQFVRELFQ